VQPRFGFYVHAVWADILRTGLLSVGFVLLLAFLRGRRIAYLVPAGLVSGYAVLARNSFGQFMLLVPAFLAAVAWVQGSETRPGARMLRAALPAAVFASALLAVVGPQLYANWQRGHGLRLAHNSWRNIEFGLRGPTPTELATPDAFTWQRAREIYFAYGRGYREHEVGARQRALDFVLGTPPAAILRRQTEKFVFLLFSMPSTFERLLVENKRWGVGPSARLAPLVGPSRVLWYGLLSLGLLGLVGVGWRSPGWLLLSIFSLYFFAALFVVGLASRFLIPLMPTLCVLAAGAAAPVGAWVLDRLGRRARALDGRR
jgi:hypothetical protein